MSVLLIGQHAIKNDIFYSLCCQFWDALLYQNAFLWL